MEITDYNKNMTFYVSQDHGCVYAMIKDQDSDGDYLVMTPMNADNTFSLNDDDWVEVDEMALLGEEQHIQDHVEQVWKALKEDRREP